VQQWQAAYGSPPIGASGAEAYDLMLFLGQGIKDAPTPDRAGLIQGLTMAAATGFAGAEGHIGFTDRSVSVAGVVVVWENGAETLGVQGP
jgi:ABC-type branched-subunit amino acid transport system substrate-binding protein